ncbi:MAG: hypothetical protein UEA60_04580 [Lachnospiraceae bacterium]|nr:hypothetical protein [Lachnospiraceae bacterium]
MIRTLRNIIGVSFALLLSFLLFIVFLEKRYDTYCYEKEDCVEATVTHVSLIKKSGRYSSNVSIEYTTPKGRQKEGYLTKLSDRGIRKGDKLLVGCDEDGDARLVKRDLLTWKYIDKRNNANGMLIYSFVPLLIGLFGYIVLSHKQGIAVSSIIAIVGIWLAKYSNIYSGDLLLAIERTCMVTTVISFLLIISRWIAMRRENTECDFGTKEEYPSPKTKEVKQGKSRFSVFGWIGKRIASFGRMVKRIENVRSSSWAILCFVAASVLAVSSIYLIWGRGEYSGYKCTAGEIEDVDALNTYEDNEIVDSSYSVTFEYVTDKGEKRTYTTDYTFSKRELDIFYEDKILIGYKDDSATILEKNMYTGKYEAYDKYPIGWLMLADMFFLIGIYMITKNASIGIKKLVRAIGWILFGMLFEFSFIVSSGEDKIVYGRAIPTLIGVIKLILAVVWIIKESKISQNIEDIEYNKRISEIRARKSMFEYKKKN